MLMRREICKFKTGSKKVLAADSAAALSPPGPSHQQHGRPLDFQLTLPGHWCGSSLNQIQGWTTIQQSYSRALEQGHL